MSFNVFSRRCHAQPILVLLKRGEKILQPMISVAMFERAGPASEFLHVVAHRCHAAGMRRRCILQIRNGVFYFSERQQIPERLLPREESHTLSLVFRNVRTKKFLWFKSRRKKMVIVHKRIAHLRSSQRRRQLWLPNSLGEPSA